MNCESFRHLSARLFLLCLVVLAALVVASCTECCYAAAPTFRPVYKNGIEVGAWFGNEYRPKGANGVYGLPTAPPADEAPEEVPNFGVDRDRRKDCTPYSINGRACSRGEAWDSVTSGQLPDDKDKLRLTVIGPEAECRRVLADLETSPLLAPYKDRFVTQEYRPGEWPVTGAGFKAGPGTTIYLQKPDGKVLHRQDDYADGAAGLATAVRKADPTYDAAKDPDLRKPQPILPGLPDLPWYVWAAGAFALYLLFKKD
jgi:hypothetical protein